MNHKMNLDDYYTDKTSYSNKEIKKDLIMKKQND